MASIPVPELLFKESCGDCGQRQVALPPRMPVVGDDFDWLLRDYDSFRLFMMEELAGRFPERSRWTPADIEVVFVEALAVVLDQMSDALDRVHAEAYLDSARQPDSVRRLLALIGYDAVRHHYALSWSDAKLVKHLLETKSHPVDSLAFEPDLSSSTGIKKLLQWLGKPITALGAQPDLANRETQRQLLALIGYDADSLREAVDLDLPVHRNFATAQMQQRWYNYPHLMDAARVAGPAAVHTNHRMVTLGDYRERMEDHPLVLRAASNQRWSGSWFTIEIVAVLSANAELDQPIEDAIGDPESLLALQYLVDDFHWSNELASVDWHLLPTFRSVLMDFVDRLRMVGQEVWLKDATPVGISLSVSVRVDDNYFQTEIRDAINQALSSDSGGFFAPGRLSFGQDLYASDVIETLMALAGVKTVCLNRFKRVGDRYPDESGSGVIIFDGNEIARCDNDIARPAMGYWRLSLHGGQRG